MQLLHTRRCPVFALLRCWCYIQLGRVRSRMTSRSLIIPVGCGSLFLFVVQFAAVAAVWERRL